MPCLGRHALAAGKSIYYTNDVGIERYFTPNGCKESMMEMFIVTGGETCRLQIS